MLEGKVVLITGAGGGIGRALALGAAKAGAKVVVNDIGASLQGERGDVGVAHRVVDEIIAAGGEAVASTGSVDEPDEAATAVRTAVDHFGRLDGLVNNAGILRDGFFHKMSFADFDAVLKVSLYGAFNMSRAAADVFRAQNSGSILHMTSTSGLIGNFAQANYATAKLAMVALSKSISLDLARWNVRSNCIAPFAWSRMTSNIKADSAEQEERINRLRQMKPEKIVPLVNALLSDQTADITCQIFSVRNNELFLMNQIRPIRSVHRGEGWDEESLLGHGLPALRSSFAKPDVSADVFPWDPV